MSRILFLIVISFFCLQITAQTKAEQLAAVDGLIQRTIGSRKSAFTTNLLPAKNDGKDYFEISNSKGKILLAGNNGIAIASAFHYYLKNFANCHISWNGSNLKFPAKLPLPKEKITKQTPHNLRYYLNYCTFNYSASWWDWERWQKEIDWMAMNGINMPLALVGQNEILYRVFTNMGIKGKDLENFFSGPAYFAWFWMINLDGWGGPLPRNWMERHAALQQKILARQRAFGMKPVLPSFTGHVPPEFGKYFPKAKLREVQWGTLFPPVSVIDPSDSMFSIIGKKFLEEQTKLYGTNHYYTADVFNEVKPSLSDSTYIDATSKKVLQVMTAYDPKAVWVMQGWLFHHDRRFWKEQQIKALLNGIPNDKMVVLDLYTESNPIWRKTDAYYGKQWLWCMLHNFGGNNGMYGNFDSIANNPARDLADANTKNLQGIGLTMEAIEQNPAMYNLMLENVWNDKPININDWLKKYITQRYGKYDEQIYKAWLQLRNTVYSGKNAQGGIRSCVQNRPTLDPRVKNKVWYNSEDLIPAWKVFVERAGLFSNSEGFQYDLVDITRQVFANYSFKLNGDFVNAYKNNKADSFALYAKQFIQLIDDMDETVATNKYFLLGRWIADARAWGNTAEEKRLYELNARNLITTWGDKNSALKEYSCRQWSGLLKDFYKPRWQQFFTIAEKGLRTGNKYDDKTFEKQIVDWEWSWITSNNIYSAQPKGNAIAVCKKMFDKYYPVLK